MKICRFAFFAVLAFYGLSFARVDLDIPPLKRARTYGDILMDRASTKNGMAPVAFSHWVHRSKYTCKVCHYELEFAMRVNETALICNRGEVNGMHCTKCHDGKTSFAPKEAKGKNCSRCHTGKSRPNADKFAALEKRLPKRSFRDQKGKKVVWIDWVKALDEGAIKPRSSLSEVAQAVGTDRTLSLEAEKGEIPPAVFPHKIHEEWLDCSSCHPDIFNIKKKTTKHFSMDRILKGEFCGVCHLSVAFPLNDCARCHPGMK